MDNVLLNYLVVTKSKDEISRIQPQAIYIHIRERKLPVDKFHILSCM